MLTNDKFERSHPVVYIVRITAQIVSHLGSQMRAATSWFLA